MRRASGLIIMAAAAVLASSAVAAQACDRAKSANTPTAAACDTKSCPASAGAPHAVTAAKKSVATRSASARLAKKPASPTTGTRSSRGTVAVAVTASQPSRATTR